MTDLKALQNEIHQNSVDHGFWEASADIPTKLMLIVTEVAEAMEDYRNETMSLYWRIRDNPLAVRKVSTDDGQLIAYDEGGNEIPFTVSAPEGFPVELADIVIRILDLAGWLGVDLGAVIDLKMAYNATRPQLHGGKKV